MSRSKWKGFYISQNLIYSKNVILNINQRSSAISSFYLGKLVKIHDGKNFKILNVTRDKIGYKFGEFSYTRKMYEKKKKKKGLKKK
jgi:small subunit ribosomal protein S19